MFEVSHHQSESENECAGTCFMWGKGHDCIAGSAPPMRSPNPYWASSLEGCQHVEGLKTAENIARV